MSTPSDDAQREMEQRALRNVRGLVDKVEGQDQADRRTERRMILRLLVGLAIAVVAVGAYFALTADKQPRATIVIQPKR